jgi:hypothetical protein
VSAITWLALAGVTSSVPPNPNPSFPVILIWYPAYAEVTFAAQVPAHAVLPWVA